MKSLNCHQCGNPIHSGDKFCQNCGTPVQEIKAPLTEKREVKQLDKLGISGVLKSLIIAVFLGLIFGWVRYWIGYYILIQGVIAGLLIPWVVVQFIPERKNALAQIRFKMALILFFTFMIGQMIGFGWAQPVFDPLNWVGRVWNGDSNESVFGIFSTAGVVSRTFSEGVSGGFWLLLTVIDLFFMFFFILVSMPLTSKKVKS